MGQRVLSDSRLLDRVRDSVRKGAGGPITDEEIDEIINRWSNVELLQEMEWALERMDIVQHEYEDY